MELIKTIGFQVESLKDFAGKLDISLSSDLDQIFIAGKDLKNLIKLMSFPKNTPIVANVHVACGSASISSIPCRKLLETILLQFKQILFIWNDCYLFHRAANQSFEPLARGKELNEQFESFVAKQKTDLRGKRKSGGTHTLKSVNEPLLKKVCCHDQDMFEEIIDTPKISRTTTLKKNRRMKLKRLFPKKCIESSTASSKAEEIFLNPFLYDWKQRTRWQSMHPLSHPTVDSLMRHIVFVDIIDNPSVLHEWLNMSEDWIDFRLILKDFITRESKIVRNNGYARILNHHLKGIDSERHQLLPINKKLVGLYVSDILRRVLPMKLFSDTNKYRKKMITAVVNLVFGAKDEGFLLQNFIDCFDPESKWLTQIPEYFRTTIAIKFAKFLINGYILLVIKNNFYITDSGSSGFELFYYRKSNIESTSIRTLCQLISSEKLTEVVEDDNCLERKWLNGGSVDSSLIKENDFLSESVAYRQPVARFRFLPKTSCNGNVRIITTVPKVKLTKFSAVLEKRRNKRKRQLTLVKSFLECILSKVGTGIRPLPSDPQLKEAWSKICTLKETMGRSFCKRRWFKYKITALSLFYHEHLNASYVGDILMEPAFWFVDNFAKFLGPFFIMAVVALTGSVVALCFMIGLPYWWHRSKSTTIALVVFGHWLLANIIFHYFMGCTVSPGQPPEAAFIPEAVSICKKCIAPKPPRTHHCSVCNKCILKMDHHCPWLNNCVGFRNHRHFFLYMCYMTLGVFFLIVFGCELFLERVWWIEEDPTGHPVRETSSALDEIIEEEEPDVRESNKKWERGALLYVAFLCVGVFVALGSLIVWHARLITRGETSIEGNINKAEVERYAKRGETYHNPYDLGRQRNWQVFFGIEEFPMITGMLRVLFPSTHSMPGDGLTWPSTFSVNESFTSSNKQ